MKFNNTAHLAFKVKDLKKSLHFYCDCLGMKKKFILKNKDFKDFAQNRFNQSHTAEEVEKFNIGMKGMESVQENIWFIFFEVAPKRSGAEWRKL